MEIWREFPSFHVGYVNVEIRREFPSFHVSYVKMKFE